MLFCHLVITVCACTFVTCTLIKISQSINVVRNRWIISWLFCLVRGYWRQRADERLGDSPQGYQEPLSVLSWKMGVKRVSSAPWFTAFHSPILANFSRCWADSFPKLPPNFLKTVTVGLSFSPSNDFASHDCLRNLDLRESGIVFLGSVGLPLRPDYVVWCAETKLKSVETELN